MSAHGVDTAAVVQREHQRQAVNQVSVGNAVTSLRLLAMLDWNAFFERASRVEALLRNDPAGVYKRQDFGTRDRYRRAIEKLAKRSGRMEEEVTRQALARAATANESPANHVGYHLIGDGLTSLRQELNYRPTFGDRLGEGLLHHPKSVYFGSVIGLATLFLATLSWAAGAVHSPWIALLLVVAFLPASELAVYLTNTLLTWVIPPRVLPKLELKDGIPPECATCVVVPCLINTPAAAAELVQRLEVHYLANPDSQLRFALLTDFADAAMEHQPSDDAVVQAALDGIATLNRRHIGDGPPRFFLFHRARCWNALQGCWMGWERKRGKLSEFNRLIRGAHDTSYTVFSAEPSALAHIRYVLTLDADTRLPQEAARRLIGTLAHPLNRPRFEPKQRRVVAGYAVLQPRVSYHLGRKRRTMFSRVWAASAGIDPYSAAVSDVYQDLFGAGSFTGKGIYDVDAFESVAGSTFPDNHILSHDLIEGNYARCGLVTDIEVFDDFPSRYHAFARREHRWVRGDWQLLPWLGRTVPVPTPVEDSGRQKEKANVSESSVVRRPWSCQKNCLPLPERWKILDNLRRSLVPPALVVMLLVGWMLLPGPAWLWSVGVAAVLCAPLVVALCGTVMQGLRNGLRTDVRGLRYGLGATAAQMLLGTIFLADLAYQAADAILRTLARLIGRVAVCWSGRLPRRRKAGSGRVWATSGAACGRRRRWPAALPPDRCGASRVAAGGGAVPGRLAAVAAGCLSRQPDAEDDGGTAELRGTS